MKKKTAAWILAAGIAALTIVLIWGISMPNASGVPSVPNDVLWARADTEAFFEEYPAEGIDAINIDLSRHDLRVVPDDRDTIRVIQYGPASGLDSRYLIHTSRSGSALNVSSSGTDVHVFFGLIPYTRVEISVPEKYDGSILAGTTSGDVDVEGVSASSLRIETTSGEADAADIRNAREVTVSATSGDAELSRFSASDVTVRTTSGDVDVNEVQADSLRSETTSGDAELVSIHADTLQCSASSGSVSVRGASEVGVADIDSTSGDVSTTFDTLREYTRSATSGSTDLTVKDAAELKSIRAEASSGDVYIALPDGTSVRADLRPTSGSTYTRGIGTFVMSDSGIPVEVSTTSGSITLEAA